MTASKVGLKSSNIHKRQQLFSSDEGGYFGRACFGISNWLFQSTLLLSLIHFLQIIAIFNQIFFGKW